MYKTFASWLLVLFLLVYAISFGFFAALQEYVFGCDYGFYVFICVWYVLLSLYIVWKAYTSINCKEATK